MHEPVSTPLADLAAAVRGTLAAVPVRMISGAAPLDEVAPGQITFIDQAERSAQASASQAAAVVVPRGTACEGKPTIEVDDVHLAFARIVETFRPRRPSGATGISPVAHVSPTAQLGERVVVHAGAGVGEEVVIGSDSLIYPGVQVMPGCHIGEGVTLFPNVTLYEDTIVGDRTIIHAGSVVGAYGFGYRQEAGRHELSAQLGNVEIGADVEIGANTTIDRGTYSATRIGEGTKIDNLVQIGHNCQIGRHNILCAQVGIAGSTSTGDYVVMAGQVGVRDHVHIGTGATIGAMAGVSNDVAEGVSAFGAPATPARQQKLLLAALAKLPEMRKEFKQVRKSVRQLEASAADSPKLADPAA
ncbi:MAG: UDP-3-O-(3-hydroxymyristoyl)glucosamine N-acyltransferase [Aeoliella sp.]